MATETIEKACYKCNRVRLGVLELLRQSGLTCWLFWISQNLGGYEEEPNATQCEHESDRYGFRETVCTQCEQDRYAFRATVCGARLSECEAAQRDESVDYYGSITGA